MSSSENKPIKQNNNNNLKEKNILNNINDKKINAFDVLVEKPINPIKLEENINVTSNKICSQIVIDFEKFVKKFGLPKIPVDNIDKKTIFCTSEIIDPLLFKTMINFYFYEYVVSSVENKFLKSETLKEVYRKHLELVNYLEIPNSKCDITKICNNLKLVAKREFYYHSNQSFNRIYCKSFCYSSMSNFLRGVLIKNNYIDIDLENSGPSILYDFALKHDIYAPYLKQLVHNRENFYKKVDNTSRDNAKMIVIQTINRIIAPEIDICKKLLEEIFVIRKKIWECRKDWGFDDKFLLKSKTKKAGTHRDNLRRVQSRYCSYKESESIMLLKSIVETFLTYNFEKRKIFGESVLPYSFIPTFDGALIRMYDLNLEENRTILNDLINITNVELGREIKFKIKPINLNKDFDPVLFNKYKNIELFLQSVSLSDLKKFCEKNDIELFQFSTHDLETIKENFINPNDQQYLNFKLKDEYRFKFMLHNKKFYLLLKMYADDLETLENFFNNSLKLE